VAYRFGDFTLDDDIRQLFLSRTEVHLSPKAYELLTVLLANRSRAVSKAELQQRLWPSTFVEETNLASLVAEIRRALGDSASSPVFVRTVYGFGYRFVGDVTVDAAATRSFPSRVKLCVVWAGREMILMEGANIIGREPDATIQIDARGVSRHHARILVANDVATVEDLGSKNGTHVNGQLVTTAARLSDGDEINLGTITLTFRIASLLNPTETVPMGPSS
jgi:DNA-binding winged helix-turn-helix (wHTH) protein